MISARAAVAPWIVTLLTSVLSTPAQAQDLHVYTVVRQADSPTLRKEDSIQGRNVTLFHAGKVYDYTYPAQELTVYDSVSHEFTVLNSKRRLATTISEAEIRHYLDMAEAKAEEFLGEASQAADPTTLATARVLEFQLHPIFRSTFVEKPATLSMRSDIFQYTIACMEPKADPEAVTRYLDYADWIAQLNSVLHPQAPFPAARLRVNEQLRTQAQLPVTVELSVLTERAKVQLRAEHTWTWKLSTRDREMINGWEKELKDPLLKRMAFAEFQKVTLTPLAASRGPGAGSAIVTK